MTTSEREKVSDLIMRIQVILAAPLFGTVEQHQQLEDIAGELELLNRE